MSTESTVETTKSKISNDVIDDSKCSRDESMQQSSSGGVGDDIFNLNSFVDKQDFNCLKSRKKKKELESSEDNDGPNRGERSR